jgi:cytochrome c-type biogenesis protein CcmH
METDNMIEQAERESDRSGEPRSSLSRRAFLIRGIAVAGGAVALPAVSQEPASCSTRTTASGAAPGSTGVSGVPANVNEHDLNEVTDSILCEGKCGLTVYEGEPTGCSIAAKMKGQAASFLAQGMSPQQALDRFAADFGEGVLASPSRSGFNLLAWLVPLAGLGLGGAIVVAALTNWKRTQPVTVQIPEETDPTMLSRIEAEVEEGS